MSSSAATIDRNAWLKITAPRPLARARLFCFSYAGGGASVYRSWSNELPEEIEVCAIQLPGRENRLFDQPFSDLEALVETLADVLQPHLDRPFAFFGHSMGALVAFELARELRRRGQSGPFHLLASGHRAPQLASRRRPIHHLPEAEFVEELRRLNGTPAEVLGDPELMALVLPTLRGDFATCERYVYQPLEPLDCPISAFGGLQDPDVGYDDLSLWAEQTRAAFTQRMLPGDHFFLRNNSVRGLLQRAICKDLGLVGSQVLAGAR